MCRIVEELCNEARSEARYEQIEKFVLKMYKQNKSNEEIADFLEIPLSTVEEVLANNAN